MTGLDAGSPSRRKRQVGWISTRTAIEDMQTISYSITTASGSMLFLAVTAGKRFLNMHSSSYLWRRAASSVLLSSLFVMLPIFGQNPADSGQITGVVKDPDQA